MFRAREVHLYKVRIQREYGYQMVSALAQFDVNLIDLQGQIGSQNKEYYNQLRRCDEIMGKINDLHAIIVNYGLEYFRCPNYEGFLKNQKVGRDYLISVEDDINHRLQYIIKQQQSILQVIEKRNRLYEQKAVVICTSDIVSKDQGFLSRMRQQGHLRLDAELGIVMNEEQAKLRQQHVDIKLNCLAGCIDSEEVNKFNRLLFRSTRQNAMAKFWSIERDMINGDILNQKNESTNRSVFMILYSSGIQDYTRQKINKICEIFNVTFYDLPNDAGQIEIILSQLNQEIESLSEVIEGTKDDITQSLTYFSSIHSDQQDLPYDAVYQQGCCSYLEEVKLNILVEANVYYHLNFFQQKSSIILGEMWCESSVVDALKQQFSNIPYEIIRNVDEEKYEPPTLIYNNDFIYSFQELVNTYGHPRYGEINPGLFTIITFPFLFGIMFGDIGHGGLLTMLGLYLLIRGNTMLKNTHQESRSDPSECRDIRSIYQARFLLVLMGCFSCYCGFIYNDFFSSALNYSTPCIAHERVVCQPEFGIDGGWTLSKQYLTFMNSFKMKTSIVVGVTHMTIGILLKGWNSLYLRQYLDFVFDFIPQLLFMTATFGYMTFLIVLKWITEYEDTSQAPSIITTMLTMYFTLGGVSGREMYPNQVQVQQLLILITLVTPLLMLCPKPIIKVIDHEAQRRIQVLEHRVPFHDEEEEQEQHIEKSYGQLKESRAITAIKHFTPGEVYIEAAIETIEFVLGAVSNTASYLRLWALSLAHAQLSEVFFDMTLKAQLKTGSIGGIIFGFMVFASITFMVLMCMDVLECFLHALRLHWVEFQNKFYKADGLQFQSLNHLKMLLNGIEFSSRM